MEGLRRTVRKLGWARVLVLVLTLMLAGRAMTLAFIGRVGDGGAGDPPDAWLMPLIGDAVVGLLALPVAWLILRGGGLWAWTAVISWNVVGIWDALSAWLIHRSEPWPEFFMIETFGQSMFFAAAAVHVICIALLARADVRGPILSTGNDVTRVVP